MPALTWQFPSNEFDEHEGFNHAGISHFTDNREINLIRESIQNSLDARAGQAPVKVECSLLDIPPSAFAGGELRQILDWVARSPHNDDKGREQLNRVKQQLDYNWSESVPTLCIKDSNTTGAQDVPRPGNAPSQWESLTKGSGLPAKEKKDAAGSFGLGKHSAFAVTDLRTVLYSTAWRDSTRLNRRFIGRAILVSHYDGESKPRRGTGYLSSGEPTAPPLKDDAVPHTFGLTQQGTAIYIPGYRLPPTSGRPAWVRARIANAIDNYFHAIVRGNLIVSVDGAEVNADNISEKYNALAANERRPHTANFIRVSQSDPVATENFAGIGKVNLRIQVYDDQKTKSRDIALVRDSGMMITNRPTDMAMPLGRIPSLWRGFTAVIECISEPGQSSYIRDSESPNHDRLYVDYIDDPERKRDARSQLTALGKWVREQIEAVAGFQKPESDDYVDELAKYLPITDDDAPASDFDKPVTVSITGLQQSRATGGGAGLLAGEHGGGGGRGRRRLPRRGDGPGGTGGGRGDTGTGQRPPRSPVTGIRVRPVRGETQLVTATFDNQGQTLSEVQLVAVGEDGAQYPLRITEASSGGQQIDVADGVIRQLPSSSETRYQLTIRTIEPVVGKTFRLVSRRQGNNQASGGTA